MTSALKANARDGQRAKKEYNLVMIHPDEGGEGAVESYNTTVNASKMKEYYKGWNITSVTLFSCRSCAHVLLTESKSSLILFLHRSSGS